MQEKQRNTSIRSRLKAFYRKYKKPFAYALLAALPFVVLWYIIVWILARCQ